MKKINLYDISGAALIYPAKTGFHFTNQVNGGACDHPILEGILIPFNNDYPIEQPEEFIENKLCLCFSAHGWGEITSDEADEADEIDKILSAYSETKGVSVNREKLVKSVESWVWVKCKETKQSCFEGFGEFEAILTWPNSD